MNLVVARLWPQMACCAGLLGRGTKTLRIVSQPGTLSWPSAELRVGSLGVAVITICNFVTQCFV